jgi:hypothetical protein
VKLLPNGSAVVEMISDYAVLREQVRACERAFELQQGSILA